MPIWDILFPMLSYPVVATATDSIERAVRFAAGLGAHFGRDIRAGHPFADRALRASARDRRHPRGRTAEKRRQCARPCRDGRRRLRSRWRQI
jgi:hypothetical protein